MCTKPGASTDLVSRGRGSVLKLVSSCRQTKSPGRYRGFELWGLRWKSVFGDDWRAPAKLVVHTDTRFLSFPAVADLKRRERWHRVCNRRFVSEVDREVLNLRAPVLRKCPLGAGPAVQPTFVRLNAALLGPNGSKIRLSRAGSRAPAIPPSRFRIPGTSLRLTVAGQ
jgi:hypothetical protein